MSIKSDALEIALVVGAVGAGLWWIQRRVTGAASAVGAAISDTASSAWNTATTPIDLGSSIASDLGTGIVEAPANSTNALSFGTIGGGGGLGLWDTLKSGPLGGLVGMISGDGNTNMIGPAPSAGIDFGTGANDWSS
jgi:hypothetical protein